MIKSKKGMSAWIWILIILILLGIGIGFYFLLSGGAGGIPQPPALPN
jgi:uncharacterized membrane protein YczE|tara:strand:- start:284 stop:424 length:141 start_codon:yes stop_codon:yes gene_type:complete